MGNFTDPNCDKKVSNSFVVRTYEACSFNILCCLFGCFFSHKCCQTPLVCMSRHTLIMFFLPNMVQTTFSQMFFSICIKSKVWQVANVATSKTVQLSFIPITTTSLHFKTVIIKHKRYTWHLNVTATLNMITLKWKQPGKKSYIITTFLRGKHSNGKQVISILKP